MNIDTVQIQLSQNAQNILQWILGFVMFGIALDTKLSDFKIIWQQPKSVVVGAVAQLLLFPAVSFLLVWCLHLFPSIAPAPSVALGMLLVAACPGGNISNFLTYFSRGNVALSVVLSAISTLLAAVMTPFNFAFWSSMLPSTQHLVTDVSLSFQEMFYSVAILLGMPMVAGLAIAYFFPNIAAKAEKPMKILSLLFFLALVVGALGANWKNFTNHIHEIILVVFFHNLLGLLLGWTAARITGLGIREQRTISIEVGIQNSGLGLILCLHYFPNLGGMAMIAAWWGIWHIISGLTIATYWRNRAVQEEL